MLGMFIAIRIWQFPGLLSGQSYIYGIKTQICLYVHMVLFVCMYKDTFASICFSISLYPHILKIMGSHWYLKFYSDITGFILVFSFCIFIPSFSNNEEPDSSYLWLMYSFPLYVTHLCSPHLAHMATHLTQAETPCAWLSSLVDTCLPWLGSSTLYWVAWMPFLPCLGSDSLHQVSLLENT